MTKSSPQMLILWLHLRSLSQRSPFKPRDIKWIRLQTAKRKKKQLSISDFTLLFPLEEMESDDKSELHSRAPRVKIVMVIFIPITWGLDLNPTLVGAIQQALKPLASLDTWVSLTQGGHSGCKTIAKAVWMPGISNTILDRSRPGTTTTTTTNIGQQVGSGSWTSVGQQSRRERRANFNVVSTSLSLTILGIWGLLWQEGHPAQKYFFYLN